MKASALLTSLLHEVQNPLSGGILGRKYRSICAHTALFTKGTGSTLCHLLIVICSFASELGIALERNNAHTTQHAFMIQVVHEANHQRILADSGGSRACPRLPSTQSCLRQRRGKSGLASHLSRETCFLPRSAEGRCPEKFEVGGLRYWVHFVCDDVPIPRILGVVGRHVSCALTIKTV
eukprot:1113537-Amphidinium_carterae.1